MLIRRIVGPARALALSQRQIVAGNIMYRSFSHSIRLYQKDETQGSIFGEVTKKVEPKDSSLSMFSTRESEETEQSEIDKQKADVEAASKRSNKSFLSDPAVIEAIGQKPIVAKDYLLSPLKKRLYEEALRTGGYSKDKVIELDGKKYKLSLTKEELEVLEPSVYISSYRLKYSPKKATLFTRMLRRLNVQDAITQCHFSSKKISRDVADMLTRGVEDAKKLGLDPERLRIAQIWVGKERYYKRIDPKGRGRAGIIRMRYVHVKAILKRAEDLTKKKLQTIHKRAARKVYLPLASKTIGDYPRAQSYRW